MHVKSEGINVFSHFDCVVRCRYVGGGVGGRLSKYCRCILLLMNKFLAFITTAVVVTIIRPPKSTCGLPCSLPLPSGKSTFQPKQTLCMTKSSSSSHLPLNVNDAEDYDENNKWGTSPPYLAVLTELDACSSIQRVKETIDTIDKATLDGNVNLVVIRVDDDANDDNNSLLLHKWSLLKSLAELKNTRQFRLVVNNDVNIVLQAISQNINVDGVHVKEHNKHLIPSIRSQLEHAIACCSSNDNNDKHKYNIIIGTSCHSIQSAHTSYELSPRDGPDYLFVGTCYLTQSHPEKVSVDQLEGPSLPGRVKKYLYKLFNNSKNEQQDMSSPPPVIFAIGGIDETNCHEPVTFGADGVATIRTVMQAFDPRSAAQCIKNAMKETTQDI